MNLKSIVTVLVLVWIFSLLSLFPAGRNFREKYIDKYIKRVGSFLTGMKTKVEENRGAEKKFDVTLKDASSEVMNGQSFPMKQTGFEGKIVYDSVTLGGGTLSFSSGSIDVKIGSMIGMVTFQSGKVQISGSADAIEVGGVKYEKVGTEFLIAGMPIDYKFNIDKDKLEFSGISGYLSWSGLKGIPPLLKDDSLRLTNFQGVAELKGNSLTLKGTVGKITLNGIDLTAGG